MVAAMILWAAAEMLVFLLPQGPTIPVIVLVRYTTHLIALAILTALLRRGSPWRALVQTRRPALQIGRGLLMLGMPLFAMMAASRGPQSTIWAIFWLAPCMVIVLAYWLLKSRATRNDWLLVLVAGIGVVLLLRPSIADIPGVFFPALAMSLCFSLYFVLTRALRTEWVATNLFYTAASVFVPLVIAAPFFWAMPPAGAWPILVAIGLVGLVALYVLDRATESADPVALAPLLNIEPIALAGMVALLQGARPGRSALAGMAIIVTAALVTYITIGARESADGGTIFLRGDA